ncbi:5-bromo-4-chloroindolyl phosphate hydrolysis family protein [Bacillus sp. FJAT-49736]|nr:5-bromo-4-chloroindolyl phosphate hydrolysis family protein [Bacillus sp. FJAT-49736]
MNSFFSFITRTLVAVPATVLIWLISFLGFKQTFMLSSVTAILGGAILYFAVKWISISKYLKKQQLSRKEFAYIVKNLKEAKKKIGRMQRVFFHVRNIGAFKQMLDLIRLVKRIYAIIRKEPRRFYQAEKFFFYHLDSIVELSEKYAFLAAQPVKNNELLFSLKDTRNTLKELKSTIENDLYDVLSKDIDHLEFELNVAKHTLQTPKDPLLDDDERRSAK